jgi:hypothetical protein
MRRLIPILILALPAVALAAPNSFSELTEQIMRYLNAAIGTSIILALVIYFYGIASGLTSLQSGTTEQLRQRIVWGLIALFVMVSVWGIVGLVRNTLFGGGAGGGGGTFEGSDCITADCLG